MSFPNNELPELSSSAAKWCSTGDFGRNGNGAGAFLRNGFGRGNGRWGAVPNGDDDEEDEETKVSSLIFTGDRAPDFGVRDDTGDLTGERDIFGEVLQGGRAAVVRISTG